MSKKVAIFCILFLVLVCGVCFSLLSFSSVEKYTLNRTQLVYYRWKAERGDQSAMFSLCLHFIYGKEKNADKGEYWLGELSAIHEKRKQVIEMFEQGLKSIRVKDTADVEGTESSKGSSKGAVL